MEFFEVSPSQLEQLVRHLIRNPIASLMILGKPGIGKTSIVKKVAKEENREVIEIYLSLRDPSDLFGSKIPVKAEDGSWYIRIAVPEIITRAQVAAERTAKAPVILMDEFSHASPMTLKATYQLLLERKIEDKELPEGTLIILCGNRDYENLGWSIEEFPVAFLDRCIRVELVSSLEDWLNWAYSRIDPRILGFIKYKPELLDRSPLTPRTWERVSNLLATIDSDKDLWMIAGIIGPGTFSTFKAWLEVLSSFNVMDILDNPDKLDRLDDQKKLAFSVSLIALLKKEDQSIYQKALKILEKLDEELVVFIIKASPQNFCRYFFRSPISKGILKKIGDLLFPEE